MLIAGQSPTVPPPSDLASFWDRFLKCAVDLGIMMSPSIQTLCVIDLSHE